MIPRLTRDARLADEVRPAYANVLIGSAIRIADGEALAAHQNHVGVCLPTAHDQIEGARSTIQEPLSFSERQLEDVRSDKDVITLPFRPAVIHVPINGVISGFMILCMSVSVMS